MRKWLTVAVAALTVLGGVLPAAEALARDGRHYGRDYYGGYGGYRSYGGYGTYGGYGYGYGRRHHHHRGDGGADEAIIAGIVGLAIGAAIASSSNGGRRDRYDDGYRGDAYRDDRCQTVTEWDPRSDRYVRRTRCW